MKRITVILILFLQFCGVSSAASFEALRRAAVAGGSLLGEGTFIEGIVSGSGPNAELNLNIAPGVVDTSINDKTAYIESTDGRFGFRLKFETPEDNILETGDLVRLNLAYCTVGKASDPDRYTIYGLSKGSVQKLGKAALPLKLKKLSDLTDDDIYTKVTIPALELLAKQGSWCNIYERCALKSRLNDFAAVKYGCPETSAAMDGWGTMLLSDEGETIMMMVNSLCLWRRGRLSIPQGAGPVSGVLVHHEVRRYGGGIGRWCLRPMEESDIVLGAESSYETLCQWDWNRNYHFSLNFRSGEVRCIDPKGMRGDVLPDFGQGLLSSQAGDKLSVIREYDARSSEDGQIGTGGRAAAALRINSETSSWYDTDGTPRGLVVSTSTKGYKGKLYVFFSFAAGIVEQPVSGFPVDWTIQYSTDGKVWKPAAGEVSILRPLQYRVGGEVIADAAMGFTEHAYVLPEECSAQKDLRIRLVPASQRVASVPLTADASIDTDIYDEEKSTGFTMALGMISIKSLKTNKQ